MTRSRVALTFLVGTLAVALYAVGPASAGTPASAALLPIDRHSALDCYADAPYPLRSARLARDDYGCFWSYDSGCPHPRSGAIHPPTCPAENGAAAAPPVYADAEVIDYHYGYATSDDCQQPGASEVFHELCDDWQWGCWDCLDACLEDTCRPRRLIDIVRDRRHSTGLALAERLNAEHQGLPTAATSRAPAKPRAQQASGPSKAPQSAARKQIDYRHEYEFDYSRTIAPPTSQPRGARGNEQARRERKPRADSPCEYGCGEGWDLPADGWDAYDYTCVEEDYEYRDCEKYHQRLAAERPSKGHAGAALAHSVQSATSSSMRPLLKSTSRYLEELGQTLLELSAKVSKLADAEPARKPAPPAARRDDPRSLFIGKQPDLKLEL